MVCAARPGREMTRHANNTMSKRFSSGKGNKPVCGFGGFGRPYSAEANALARLAAVPSPCGVRHVPKLLGRDDARFELHFSNDGLTLSTPAARQALCALSRDDVMRQAECIDAHLALAGVRHLDMKYQGDNAALDAEGRISIIDFDISTVDDVPRLLKNCRFAYQKVSATIRVRVNADLARRRRDPFLSRHRRRRSSTHSSARTARTAASAGTSLQEPATRSKGACDACGQPRESFVTRRDSARRCPLRARSTTTKAAPNRTRGPDPSFTARAGLHAPRQRL